jgi:hypothetical protein
MSGESMRIASIGHAVIPGSFQFVFRYRPGITGPTQVLVRDEKVLGQVEDVENFYLTELVPAPRGHGSRVSAEAHN